MSEIQNPNMLVFGSLEFGAWNLGFFVWTGAWKDD
jgi:hypothetical protein